MESISNGIDPIQCHTAIEFIERISAIPEGIGEPDFRNRWVYRGHGDADWELKPAAWREDGRSILAPLRTWLKTNIADSHSNLPQRPRELATEILTEVIAVIQFCGLADEIGLVIPDASNLPHFYSAAQRAFQGLPQSASGISREFFNVSDSAHNILTPAAYAQHHSVPTRLLDWTRNPLFAAFFALQGQATCSGSGSICVWAALPQRYIIGGLCWATVPRGYHPYVHAQDGVFSLSDNSDEYFMTHGIWPSLLQTPADGGAHVKKWILPRSQSEELRKQLFIRGISHSRLMPTLDNVGVDTKRRWNWY